MITTRSPLRISLGGGGTDLRPWLIRRDLRPDERRVRPRLGVRRDLDPGLHGPRRAARGHAHPHLRQRDGGALPRGGRQSHGITRRDVARRCGSDGWREGTRRVRGRQPRDDGGGALQVSEQASLPMSDAPGAPSTMVSLWQTNSAVLKTTRYANWKRCRDGMAQVLSGVGY